MKKSAQNKKIVKISLPSYIAGNCLSDWGGERLATGGSPGSWLGSALAVSQSVSRLRRLGGPAVDLVEQLNERLKTCPRFQLCWAIYVLKSSAFRLGRRHPYGPVRWLSGSRVCG